MTPRAGYGRKFRHVRYKMAVFHDRVYYPTKKTFAIFVILVLCGIYFISTRLYVGSGSSSKVEIKVILSWTTFFGNTSYLPPNLLGLGCEVDACIVSHNHSNLPVSEAIVFHWRDLTSDLPKTRTPKQQWVLLNYESPVNVPWRTLQPIVSAFNLTVTYRLDSDIVAPYGKLRRRQGSSPGLVETLRTFERKKLVAWMVSHCRTASKRERFVKMLKRYIAVDVYGDCGHLQAPCSRNDSRIYCYSILANMYKFYLSFENSLCLDYVTEKLYLPLSVGLIPIVMGSANYSRLLPPNSFIDALAFSTPEKLAAYLLEVGSNFTLYRSYLAWRENYELVHSETDFYWLCDLCRLLHSKPVKRQVTTSWFFEWWFTKAACHPWIGYSEERNDTLQTVAHTAQQQNFPMNVNHFLHSVFTTNVTTGLNVSID